MFFCWGWIPLLPGETNMRMSARVGALVACCGLMACEAEREEAAPAAVEELKTAGQFLRTREAVPGRYIVVLKETGPEAPGLEIAEAARSLAARHGMSAERTYQHALRGFVALGSEAQARALAHSPEVAYVVEDGIVRVAGYQNGAVWNLDRIDQRSDRDGVYTYDATGSGVHVYIIDTGIRTTHPEFGGRATKDYSSVVDGWIADDCHGHGTHVAGTVGGATWGVAKEVALHSIRVMGCDGTGTSSQLIGGIDWVTEYGTRPAVANISLVSSANQAVDDAVQNSIARGVVYTVAAGNSTGDACRFSPSRAPNVLTVAATDQTDSRVAYSNYGGCVDLFAPGLNISAAHKDGGEGIYSGTSVAAPHVAGVAALFLQSNPLASPSRVADFVLGHATPNVVNGAGPGSPNRLLHSRLPTTPQRAALHRYYNSVTGDHFYTTNWYEVGGGGFPWSHEGVTGYVAMGGAAGTTHLYRYHNTSNGDHFYTTNWSELGNGGGVWKYQGITGNVPTGAAAGTTPLYRYFHTGNGDHFYTANWNEVGGGGGPWVYQGITSYIFTGN